MTVFLLKTCAGECSLCVYEVEGRRGGVLFHPMMMALILRPGKTPRKCGCEAGRSVQVKYTEHVAHREGCLMKKRLESIFSKGLLGRGRSKMRADRFFWYALLLVPALTLLMMACGGGGGGGGGGTT